MRMMRQAGAAITSEPREGGNWCVTCEILSVIVQFDRDGLNIEVPDPCLRACPF